MKLLTRTLIIAVLLLTPSLVSAFTVYPVPYSGQLSESGTPVNGTRYVQLHIYGTAVGGLALHTQAESLTVIGGVFHTQLVTNPALWDGSDRWVGVSINGGAELIPRMKIGWVPYAIHTPRTSPQLFTAPQGSRTVTSDQWTRIDSITVTVTNPGTVMVSLLGFVQWTGSITAAPMQLDLNSTTPTDFAIYYNPPVGNANPLTMTTFKTVSAGQTKIYLWAKLTSVIQTYFVQTQRFQALFIPN